MPLQTGPVARTHATIRRWIAVGTGEALLLSLLAAFAYFRMFSFFALYDDEGYMMLTVKHLLAHHTLYDEVWTLYGPVYFAWKWSLHGLLALPLSHDVVRLTALVVWLSTALTAALTVLALTGSLALAAVVQLLVTGHLSVITNEPGHPQELAGLLTMAIVALPAIARDRAPRGTLISVGLMVAALSMIKVNLGMFTALAVWMALLSAISLTPMTGTLRAAFSVAVIAFPGLLMRPQLREPVVWNFAVMAALSIVAVSIVALTHRRGTVRPSDLFSFSCSVGGGVLLIGLATLGTGTSLAALLDCLIVAPSRVQAVFRIAPPSYFPVPIAAVGGIALAVALRATQRWHRQFHVVGLAKLAFGIAILTAAWRNDIPLLLPGLTPFLWLALLPPDGRSDTPLNLPRLILCWAAVLQILQLYPVAGSQAGFGTVLHVLVGALCVDDGVRWLRSLFPVLDRGELRAGATAAVFLAVVGLSVSQLRLMHQFYLSQVPLDLPGAVRLRMDPGSAQMLRTLTQTLRDKSDTFLSVPGFSSLYFWTGEAPPTLDVIGHAIELYSEERQEAMLGALVEHPHPILVHFRGLAVPFPPFEKRVSERFEPLMSIGPYQLLVPR
jgi:hypothetical protein